MEAFAADLRDIVVLLDAVAAYAETADDAVAAIERGAAREPHDAALVQVVAIAAARRPRAFGAGILRIVDVEIEPWSVLRLAVLLLELFFQIDARREERLSCEADRPRGDRPALARGRLRRPGVLVVLAGGRDVFQHVVTFARAEVVSVSRLRHRDVGREHGAVRHSVQRQNRAALVRDADGHARG